MQTKAMEQDIGNSIKAFSPLTHSIAIPRCTSAMKNEFTAVIECDGEWFAA
jgi:hypothetical protein